MSAAEVESVLWVVVLASVAGAIAIGLLIGWWMTRLPVIDADDPDGNARLDAIEAELDEDGPISGERGDWS